VAAASILPVDVGGPAPAAIPGTNEVENVEQPAPRLAVVSGANRGIGLEVVRQLAQRGLTVVLGARDLDRGRAAADRLAEQGLRVLPRQFDVTDQNSIDRLVAELAADFGRLDVLVNNAAILYDTWQRATDADLEVVHQALETNTFGAWRLCR